MTKNEHIEACSKAFAEFRHVFKRRGVSFYDLEKNQPETIRMLGRILEERAVEEPVFLEEAARTFEERVSLEEATMTFEEYFPNGFGGG